MVIGKFKLLLDPDEEKAAVLKPDDFKRLLRVAAFGRNGKRNVAIIWMSFGSALRDSSIEPSNNINASLSVFIQSAPNV